MKCAKITVILISLLLAGNGVGEARSLYTFWGGVLMSLAGFYSIYDGGTMVKKNVFGNIAAPDYKISNEAYIKSSGQTFTVTGSHGTIKNTGNVKLTDVVVHGLYIDSLGDTIAKPVTSQPPAIGFDLEVDQEYSWILPDVNLADKEPKLFRFEAKYKHGSVYGYKDVEVMKEENQIYLGAASIIIGGMLIVKYLSDKEIEIEEAKNTNAIKLELVGDPNYPRFRLVKRI